MSISFAIHGIQCGASNNNTVVRLVLQSYSLLLLQGQWNKRLNVNFWSASFVRLLFPSSSLNLEYSLGFPSFYLYAYISSFFKYCCCCCFCIATPPYLFVVRFQLISLYLCISFYITIRISLSYFRVCACVRTRA